MAVRRLNSPFICRVRTSTANAWQRATGGHVHRWYKEAVSYSRQNEEEGLGQYGQCHESQQLRIGVNMSQLTVADAIRQGDIILVGLRDYQDEKADVILK